MKSNERKAVVFTILSKTLLYIVAVAVTFALIIWAWENYDWQPNVKNIIRGVVIPMLLGGLLVFLLRREVSAIKDKWKPFVMFVIFLTGTLVFVNAGKIAQEASAKVMKVGSITSCFSVFLCWLSHSCARRRWMEYLGIRFPNLP